MLPAGFPEMRSSHDTAAAFTHTGGMNYVSILIAIGGLTVYQVAMKAAPRGVNPFSLLVLVYSIAAMACAAAAGIWSRVDGTPIIPTLGGRTIAAAALIAGSVILIEIGYLLVYRSGWSMAVAPAVAQAATLLLVAGIGFAVMGDRLTISRAIGLILCVGGVVLITRKA